jgi:undecaprenyl-diphosphatase
MLLQAFPITAPGLADRTLPLLLKALILGIVEGVTEFLPVSSTGHLILVGAWLDYPDPQRVTMEIFIQMGAILAVFWQYGAELLKLARHLTHDRAARDLVVKVGIAFVPAAVLGLVAHHTIEEHLFSPRSVAIALVLGGIVILVVERMSLRPTDLEILGRTGRSVDRIERTSWTEALGIGLAQMLSLIPGVSRAGATIIGGMLVGLSRPVATQFSFYLALPTISAASLFSLAKGWKLLGPGDVLPLAVGFVAAYVSALAVIRSFLAYVRTHDFRVFGWYRIAVGLLVYALLGRG